MSQKVWCKKVLCGVHCFRGKIWGTAYRNGVENSHYSWNVFCYLHLDFAIICNVCHVCQFLLPNFPSENSLMFPYIHVTHCAIGIAYRLKIITQLYLGIRITTIYLPVRHCRQALSITGTIAHSRDFPFTVWYASLPYFYIVAPIDITRDLLVT